MNKVEWKFAMTENPPVGVRVLALYHDTEALVAYVGRDGKWYEWDGEEINFITRWTELPDFDIYPI